MAGLGDVKGISDQAVQTLCQPVIGSLAANAARCMTAVAGQNSPADENHRPDRSLGRRTLTLAEQSWESFFGHPHARAIFAADLIAGILLALYNSPLRLPASIASMVYLAQALGLGGLLALVLLGRSTIVYRAVPAMVGLLNPCLLLAAMPPLLSSVPVAPDPVWLMMCSLYFLLNFAVFQPRIAWLLNLLTLGSVLLVCLAKAVWVDAAFHQPVGQWAAGSWSSGRMAVYCTALLITEALFMKVIETYLDAVERDQALALVAERDEAEAAGRLRSHEQLRRLNQVSVAEAISKSLSHELNQPLGSAATFMAAAKRWLAASNPDRREACEAVGGALAELDRAMVILGRIEARATLALVAPRSLDLVAETLEELERLQPELAHRGTVLTIRVEPRASCPMVMRKAQPAQLVKAMLGCLRSPASPLPANVDALVSAATPDRFKLTIAGLPASVPNGGKAASETGSALPAQDDLDFAKLIAASLGGAFQSSHFDGGSLCATFVLDRMSQ